MSNQPITGATEVPTKTYEPQVIRHDVTFQMRLVSFKGEPVTDDTSFGNVLMDTDSKVFDGLAKVVTDWTFRDHEGIEGARLEMCQPEFGYDEEGEDSGSLYDISIFSSHELPRLRVEATENRPISVQQLVEEVVPYLIRQYGEAGVVMELNRVQFYKKFESSQVGRYEFQ
jgi:hypothetical protein